MPSTVEVLEEPAALTPDGLADQVHQICSSNKVCLPIPSSDMSMCFSDKSSTFLLGLSDFEYRMLFRLIQVFMLL